MISKEKKNINLHFKFISKYEWNVFKKTDDEIYAWDKTQGIKASSGLWRIMS